MAKKTAGLAQARRTEIVSACRTLYQTMSFKAITLKEIAECTSFTRPSIYNYFQTKEEIFLSLLQQEYEAWNRELSGALEAGTVSDRETLAALLAETLSRRELMLRLLSMNLYDIEENSRLERLTEFKTVYRRSLLLVADCCAAAAPEWSESRQSEFIGSFFPFVYGIYPYAEATAKQRQAMAQAGIVWQPRPIREIALAGVRRLLGLP